MILSLPMIKSYTYIIFIIKDIKISFFNIVNQTAMELAALTMIKSLVFLFLSNHVRFMKLLDLNQKLSFCPFSFSKIFDIIFCEKYKFSFIDRVMQVYFAKN